jgi:nucleoside 2-deoxyribosyltransferase
MRIVLIGSSQYEQKFSDTRDRLTAEGHDVRIPAFDSHPDLDDLGICEHNRSLIEWCDRVHLIWDNRSSGTIFDFGMVFMSRKPFVIEYIESKTFEGVMRKYENSFIPPDSPANGTTRQLRRGKIEPV